MDPAVVDSAQFGQLWKVPFNAREKFYAKPLVYTPLAGGSQILFLASSQNYIRTLDAKTGDLINERQVHTPFLQADIGCTDIPDYIGIIGTPTIDTATDIVYFYSKTYIPDYRIPGDTGVMNGVYYFHGVDINSLQDVDGYPILIDGSRADNAPEKYFVGGIILQRPSLVQIGNYIYAGFGGHCDLFNYTGLVVGIDISAKAIVSQFATESGPLVEQSNVWNENGGGGQGGIWQSGMSLSTDGSRVFFVTGNGNAHENQGTPASGSSGCQTLGEAVVNLAVGDDGSLTLSDYFQPYDYQNMDGGDQDFGSGGIALLDSGTFTGTGVSRLAATAGKNGKLYILNADNLGGYRMGSGQTDNIIQTITTNKAVFGGSGSYPLEGGWIYSTPVGYPTYAYKLGFTSAGVPSFALAGQTPESSAGRVGVGIPTITTLDGKEGTAILWMTDPDAGLRAWYAVPDDTGVLKNIPLPQVNGLNKFERPAFGDTRLYVTDSDGVVYCLGSPVNLPLNCTSPVEFGNVALGSTKTETVTCTAIIDVLSVDGLTVGDARFEASNSSLPTGEVMAGQSFSFPVTWSLVDVTIGNQPNASYGNTSPGIKSTALTLYTTNGVTGYSTLFPISLTGTEVSESAYLDTSPTTVDFGGIVVDNGTISAIDSTLVIANDGLSPLTITGYGITTDDLDDSDVDWDNLTCTDDVCGLGMGFTSANLPDVGTVLAASSSVSVTIEFYPVDGVGAYSSYFQIWSDGGTTNTILEGSASTSPLANFSISNGEGGWLPPSDLTMDFGDVAPGSTTTRQIRICNNGGSVLTISKSKPPLGVIHVQTYGVDLHESQSIEVGACAYGTVLMVAPATNLNTPPQTYTNEWTLNTDDLLFGVHVVEMTGTVVSTQVGPTNSSGDAVYEYLGCYLDDDPAGRLLPYAAYDADTNENGECQTACFARGYTFTGTEYMTECWCGHNVPNGRYNDTTGTMCTFACAGDGSQACGGTGGYISIYYDPSKYTPTPYNSSNDGGGGGSENPTTPQTVSNYNYLGCYSEATDGRALGGTAPATPDTGGTLEYCAAQCEGYTYFGMEYSNECYCGNTINAGSVNQTSSDVSVNGCNMLCGGNSLEYCGGADRLDIYMVNGTATVPTQTTTTISVPTPTGGPFTVQSAGTWVYLGCYTEGTGTRALGGRLNPVANADNTVEACTTACLGFNYAGVEYSGECYCGDTFGTGSVIAAGGNNPANNGCNMVCNGNSSEYCGGSNRLDVYSNGADGSSLSSTTTTGTATPGSPSSASVTTTTTSPTPTGPVSVGDFAGWNYLGCYSEATNSRALTGLADPDTSADNSVYACAEACSGYSYFGVEYSSECYCGNTIHAGSVAQTSSDPATNQCNMVCAGNSGQYCGGSNRLNMYEAAPVANGLFSPTPSNSLNATLSTFLASSTIEPLSTSLSNTTISITPSPTLNSSSTYFLSTSLVTAATTNSSTVSSSTVTSSQLLYNSSTISSSISSSFNVPVTTSMANSTTTSSLASSSTTISTTNSSTLSSLSASATTVFTNSSTVSSLLTSSTVAFMTNSSTVSSLLTSSTAAFMTNSSMVPSSSTFSTITPTTHLSTISTSSIMLTSTSTNHSSSTSSLSTFSTISSSSFSSTTTSKATSASISSSSTLSTITSSQSSHNSTATFSSSETMSTTTSTSASTVTPIPSQIMSIDSSPYAYVGCYNDTTTMHPLAGDSYSNATGMTTEACAAFCSSQHYPLSGTESADACYCGYAFGENALAQPQSSCKMACSGNTTQFCGAENHLSVWNATSYMAPVTVPSYGKYQSQGCYEELSNGNLLSNASYTNSTSMTIESCTTFCGSKSLAYAGVKDSSECYCGSSLPTSATTVMTSNCNMLCSGSTREYCGGNTLINLYYNDQMNQTVSVTKRGASRRVKMW